MINMGRVKCWILLVSSRLSSATAARLKNKREKEDKEVRHKLPPLTQPSLPPFLPPSLPTYLLGNGSLRVGEFDAAVQRVVFRHGRYHFAVRVLACINFNIRVCVCV